MDKEYIKPATIGDIILSMIEWERICTNPSLKEQIDKSLDALLSLNDFLIEQSEINEEMNNDSEYENQ
jgi:hypothetical protein